MLCSVEVTATLILPESPFHNIHWRSGLEFTLDCFICERTGRTTTFEQGAERSVCSGDADSGPHHTAARITTRRRRSDS